MGSSGPSLPNPYGVASTQFNQYNVPTGFANEAGSQPNQWGPYGSITSQEIGSQDVPGVGNVPIYGQTTSLSPQEQELLGLQQGAGAVGGAGAINELLGANYGAVTPSTAIGDTTSGLMGQAEGQFQGYEQPFFNTQTQQLESELASQGLTPGNPAYDTALNNLRQSQGQTTSGFLSQMEPQAFQQAENLYELPMMTAQGLEGFDQPQVPGEIQYPGLSISPSNLEGDVSAYDQAAVSEYQAQQQFMGNLFAGLGNLGLSGAKLFSSPSDRRLKCNTRRIGSLFGICPIWEYRFKGSLGRSRPRTWHAGLMADEVAKFAPEAVSAGHDGYLRVNYPLAITRAHQLAFG